MKSIAQRSRNQTLHHKDTKAQRKTAWIGLSKNLVSLCLGGKKEFARSTQMSQGNTIVVIPTYNERDNIARLVSQIVGFDFHVLVVDDNSPDGTGDLADQLACGHPRIHVIHRPAKQGLGTAYVRGFQYALEQGADVICQMDADFSHDPGDVPRLLEAMKENDVAIGSRYVAGGRAENWGLLRKLMSRGANLYTRAILGLPLHDCTSGFKCFRRQALSSLNLDGTSSSGYSFQIEVNYRCWRKGYRLVEVPITFRGRKAGESKLSWAIFLEAVLLVWRLGWERLWRSALH